MRGWIAFLQSAASAGGKWHRTGLGALLLALATASIPQTALAQSGTSAESEALIVTPLSFIKAENLDFGSIIPGTNNGWITLSPGGAVTTTGGIIVLPGSSQPAKFAGYGAVNQLVTIRLNRNNYSLTRIGGTETMRLRRITIGSAPPTTLGANIRTFRIVAPSGAFAFTVGGQLRVRPNQAPGVYQTEFDVTLEYQ